MADTFVSPFMGAAGGAKHKKKKKKNKRKANRPKDEKEHEEKMVSSGSDDEFMDCNEQPSNEPSKEEPKRPRLPGEQESQPGGDGKAMQSDSERGAESSPLNNPEKMEAEEPMDYEEATSHKPVQPPEGSASPPNSKDTSNLGDENCAGHPGNGHKGDDATQPCAVQKDGHVTEPANAAQKAEPSKRKKKKKKRDRRDATSHEPVEPPEGNASPPVSKEMSKQGDDNCAEQPGNEQKGGNTTQPCALPKDERMKGPEDPTLNTGADVGKKRSRSENEGMPDSKSSSNKGEQSDRQLESTDSVKAAVHADASGGLAEPPVPNDSPAGKQSPQLHKTPPGPPQGKDKEWLKQEGGGRQHKRGGRREQEKERAGHGDYPESQRPHDKRSTGRHSEHPPRDGGRRNYRPSSSEGNQGRYDDRRGDGKGSSSNRGGSARAGREYGRQWHDKNWHEGPQGHFNQNQRSSGRHQGQYEDWRTDGKGSSSNWGGSARGEKEHGRQGRDKNWHEGTQSSRRQYEERPKYTVGTAPDGKEKFAFFFRGGSPFSQWHFCRFKVDGQEYMCAEQFMMHKKAMLFKDEAAASSILQSEDPREQKQYGREVKNFDEKTWTQHCRGIVTEGNLAKFRQNPRLRKVLLETKGMTLVEASPYDTIWGIGLGAEDTRAIDRTKWQGENLLGQILTKVREQIIREESGEHAGYGKVRADSKEVRADIKEAHAEKETPGGPVKLNRDFEGRRKSASEVSEVMDEDDSGERFEFFSGDDHPFHLQYHCPFTLGTNKFNSVEHYLFYAKAMHAGHEDIAREIVSEQDDGLQKKLSKKASKKLDMKEWSESVLPSVLDAGNTAKFAQNHQLGEKLLSTAGKTLALTSQYNDDFWGIGLSSDDPRVRKRSQWMGKNIVGESLMSVRKKILQERSSEGTEAMDTSPAVTEQSGPSN